MLDTYTYAYETHSSPDASAFDVEDAIKVCASETETIAEAEAKAEKFQLCLDSQTKDWPDSEPDDEAYELIVPEEDQPAGFFVVLKVVDVLPGSGYGVESGETRKGVRGLVYRRGHWLRVGEEDEEWMME